MFRGESPLRATLFGALVLSLLPASLGAAGAHATWYEIDVHCSPEESSLRGVAVIALREAGQPAAVLHFWLHGELQVTEVTAGGRALEYTQSPEFYRYDYSLIGNRVEVTLPTGEVPATIEVEWTGYFHPSAARSPSDYMRIDGSGVFLRGLGYSAWFPLLLEPDEDEHDVSFHRVSVTVPRGLTPVFTGNLVSTEDDREGTHATWRADSVSLSDAQLTARPFRVSTEEGVSVYSLDDPGSLASGRAICDLARSLLVYYRAHYRSDALSGPLHVVETPPFGDISSGNVIGIQESRWRSFAESDDAQRTLAHELVHPFVQPPIPRADRLYALMIEGFPSYFHYPALEALGAIDYPKRISELRESYLEKRKTGTDRRGRPLPEEKAISTIGADEIGVYKDRFVLSDRAILFLDTLRTRLGRERFEEFVRRLFAGGEMDEARFRALVTEYLPDFAAGMTVWLDTTDLPDELAR